MKKISKFYALVLAILGGSVFVACCKDEPDPCEGQSRVSADFRILTNYVDAFTLKDNWYESDTVVVPSDGVNSRDLYISANEKNAELYSCLIGTDTTARTTQNFEIRFRADVIGQRLPFRMVIHKQPNKYCFPDDDGKDTIVKYVQFVAPDKSSVIGIWEGEASSAIGRKIKLKISTRPNPNPNDGGPLAHFENLTDISPASQRELNFIGSYWTHRYFSGDVGNNPSGYFNIGTNWEISPQITVRVTPKGDSIHVLFPGNNILPGAPQKPDIIFNGKKIN